MLAGGIGEKDPQTAGARRMAGLQESKNGVNSADAEGQTALHWAAEKAEAESIR
jgi:hypothetical protein